MRKLLAAAAGCLGLLSVPVYAETVTVAGAPPTVAIVGESGLNPAHVEFADKGTVMPALPPHLVITLPPSTPGGDFGDLVNQMETGPLGRLQPGQLYRVDGTRLLIYVPSGLPEPYNVISGSSQATDFGHRLHGTGVVGAAIGATTGTAPNAWAVFIPTGDPSGVEWLAQQDWIDVASVSSYTLETVGPGNTLLPCRAAPHVREFVKDRNFFASSGNSEGSSHYLLNSMPEFYLVGGVDRNGSAVMEPRVPASPDPEEITFSAPYATRTFETGDRYEFRSVDPDSVDGYRRFGGTSGASPSTAGRAALLVDEARRLLNDDGSRSADVLAASPTGSARPAAGPLADGAFTQDELAAVLHAVAAPKLVSPGRYFAEGYGALTGDAISTAQQVLRGELPLVARPDDDRAHAASEQTRGAAFAARDCG